MLRSIVWRFVPAIETEDGLKIPFEVICTPGKLTGRRLFLHTYMTTKESS
jgi:hypothetical protein